MIYGKQRGFRTKEDAEAYANDLHTPSGKALVVYGVCEGGMMNGPALAYFVRAERMEDVQPTPRHRAA